MARCGLSTESRLVDVGCGTGIASRLFAARGLNVIGIEPNTDMRCTAAASADHGAEPSVTYRDGRAEATGLPAAYADVVLSAQAFHWFEPVATLARVSPHSQAGRLGDPDVERARRARPGDGGLWRRDPHGQRRRGHRGPRARRGPATSCGRAHCSAAPSRSRSTTSKASMKTAWWDAPSLRRMPREAPEREEWASRLKEVFRRHQQDGTVLLRYRTSIYLAQQETA